MRAGCIPIVDNRGGFREQVASVRAQNAAPDCLTPARRPARNDHSSGFLCNNPEDFARALERLLDPERRTQHAQAAYARGNDLFSLERFSKNLLEAFRQIAAGTPQAA
jgi:glycosyltransferase involved in cell wall biosynthesis